MVRVTYFISLLLGDIARDEQNIYWITDNDDFMATSQRIEDTGSLLSRFSSLYVKRSLGGLLSPA